MKLSDFNIEFIKFKNETDTFHYKINDLFFGLKDNSLFESGDIDISVTCTRNESNITLDYHFAGHIATACDRCLSDIKIAIEADRNEVLRLTANEDLLQEENYISVNYQVYNVYDSIYEQICLEMPVRKICKVSETKKECKIDHPETTTEDVVDERWAELKKLIK